MDVRVGPQRRLSTKELMLLNCGIGEDSRDSRGWTARRSNQSILKEINSEYSLEGLMLKLQYFGHLVWRIDSLEKRKRLKAGWEVDDRGWDVWMASPTWWIRVWLSSQSWWWTGKPGMLQPMGSQRVRVNWATEQQQIWLMGSQFPDQELNLVHGSESPES